MKALILIEIGAKHNQFWQQISVCIVDGDKELRYSSNIRLSIPRVVLKTTIDIQW
jgi:hypothetical protein